MLKYEVMAVNGLRKWMEQAGEKIHDFFTDERGDTNLISIVVVLVIVMALAVVFRENITTLVEGMWQSIFKDANSVTNAPGSSGGGFR